MQFSDVIGQRDIKARLVEMISHNRLSHALLFVGKEGSGALSMALAFAQYVMCETVNGKDTAAPSLFNDDAPAPAGVQTDSCGQCNSCRKNASFVHPDLHFTYPVIPKKSGDKPVSTDYIGEWREFISQLPYGNVYDWLQFIGAENKQGNITAEECNEIIRKLSLKSFESEYKIHILWMPEYLGKEGNKLLKLIEEPPLNTLFILVAENENDILPTIVSRTQVLRLHPLSTSEITEALIASGSIPVEQAHQIAAISGGNYREAIQLLQHAGDDWQALLREWLNATLKGNRLAQVKWIDEMAKQGREKQKQFLRYFNHVIGQAVRLRAMGDASFPIPDSERDFAMRLNRMADLEQLQALIEEADQASYHIERNGHPRMLFHSLTIKLYHIISHKSVILTS